jgi:DNA-binding GntR family transcriptional regulator
VECRVTERVSGGTHTVFLAEVDGAAGRPGAPLAYFRGQFGRLHLEQDEQAHQLLRTAITERSIEIATPLDVGELAQRLGVPERSAQHALVRLADEALVTQQDDGRFVVVPLTFEVVQDALRGRLAVQLGAALLGVGRMAPDQLRELRTRLEATDPVRPDGERMSPDEWFGANTAFHEHLLRAAGSEGLVQAHRRFTVPGLMTRATSPQDTLSEDLAIDHQGIVEAYEAGDVTAACDALRRDYERAVEFNRRRLLRAGGRV